MKAKEGLQSNVKKNTIIHEHPVSVGLRHHLIFNIHPISEVGLGDKEQIQGVH